MRLSSEGVIRGLNLIQFVPKCLLKDIFSMMEDGG